MSCLTSNTSIPGSLKAHTKKKPHRFFLCLPLPQPVHRPVCVRPPACSRSPSGSGVELQCSDEAGRTRTSLRAATVELWSRGNKEAPGVAGRGWGYFTCRWAEVSVAALSQALTAKAARLSIIHYDGMTQGRFPLVRQRMMSVCM